MRLVTYNIRGGLGMDGVRSSRRILSVLRDVDADIICLQEVHQRLPWSRFRDQPGHLSRALRMSVVFQANYGYGIGGFGNAILTSLPVTLKRSYRIPNRRERRSILRVPERRGLLEVRLTTPAGPLTVLTTHWSLHALDRMEATEVVASRIAELRCPVILCGDFNSVPDSPEMEMIRVNTSLRDAGTSVSDLTFPADVPSQRIDYVLHSKDLQVSHYEVRDSQASDHRPVVIEW